MGLDISYYSNVKRIPDEEIPAGVEPFNRAYDDWANGYYDKGYNLYYIDTDRGLFGGHMQGLEPGWYKTKSGDEGGYLRAGSYSGYNEWRSDLALAAGYPGGTQEVWSMSDKLYQPDSPPFLELIYFSDSDGIIGPEVSKKLYNDFVKYENNIKQVLDTWYLKFDPKKEYDTGQFKWFIDKYGEWKEAFKTASENGFVSFH